MPLTLRLVPRSSESWSKIPTAVPVDKIMTPHGRRYMKSFAASNCESTEIHHIIQRDIWLTSKHIGLHKEATR